MLGAAAKALKIFQPKLRQSMQGLWSGDLCISLPGISQSLSLSLVGGLGGPVDAFASKCVSPAGLVDALTGTQINESHVGLP
jgi:hypothetical protein